MINKPYISGLPYLTQRRNLKFDDLQARNKRRRSTLTKPYLNQGPYTETEYWLPALPGYPQFPYTNPSAIPSGEWLNIGGPWSAICRCEFLDCYCPGETTTISLDCSDPVVGIFDIDAPAGVSVSLSGGSIVVMAPEGATGAITLSVKMQTAAIRNSDGEVVGYKTCNHYDLRISKCVDWECVSCDCAGGLTWDDATSADTVARSNSCTVGVTDPLGTCGPYSWSVSGTGFTLDAAITAGATNTLNADGSACGTATITVTGCDGATVVTGYVRCTTGTWAFIVGCSANEDPPGSECSTGVRCTNVPDVDGGIYKWVFGINWCRAQGANPFPTYTWTKVSGDGSCSPPPGCGTPVECGATGGSSPCAPGGNICCTTFNSGNACGICVPTGANKYEWTCT